MVDKRLTKPRAKRTSLEIPIDRPVVKVGAPQIDMTVETDKFAEALESLAIAINQLGQQQTRIAESIAESNRLIAQLASNPPKVDVAPKISMPARPRSYSVEIEDEKGDVVQMNIAANSPN